MESSFQLMIAYDMFYYVKFTALRSLQAHQGMSDYHQLNELLHLIRTVSYFSRDTRMYFNLLYSPLPSQKFSVLLNQKFSLSEGNHRSSTSGHRTKHVPRGTSEYHLPSHPPPPNEGGLLPLNYLTMISIMFLYLLSLLLRLRPLPEGRRRKKRTRNHK